MIAILLAALAATCAVAQSSQPPPQAQVGSGYPFVQRQADRARMDWSFLNPQYRDAEAWKRAVRPKVLDLLHYDPPRTQPRPQIVERVDCGSYLREKLYFSTTPDIRVPAYVLIPKDGKARHPAVLLLHDHGAFFVWGKEKLVEIEGENPAFATFRQQYYGGRAVAN